MGTTCSLRWREAAERELVWNVAPGHPITRGLPEVFAIPEQEMYGEFFDIPPAGRAGLHLVLHGRRGVPQRLRVPPWTGADLLLQPGTRGASRLSPGRGAPRHRQRGQLDRPAWPGAVPHLRDRRCTRPLAGLTSPRPSVERPQGVTGVTGHHQAPRAILAPSRSGQSGQGEGDGGRSRREDRAARGREWGSPRARGRRSARAARAERSLSEALEQQTALAEVLASSHRHRQVLNRFSMRLPRRPAVSAMIPAAILGRIGDRYRPVRAFIFPRLPGEPGTLVIGRPCQVG